MVDNVMAHLLSFGTPYGTCLGHTSTPHPVLEQSSVCVRMASYATHSDTCK